MDDLNPPEVSRPPTPRPPSHSPPPPSSSPRPPSPPPRPPSSDPGPPSSDSGNSSPGSSGRNTPIEDEYPPATLPKIRNSLEFIRMVKEATLASQFDPEELTEFLNPWEHDSMPPDDPALKLSLLNFISFMGHPQSAYESARRNLRQCFPDIELLSYYQAERRVRSYSGVVTWEHHMCVKSCVGFTGLFADLEHCPVSCLVFVSLHHSPISSIQVACQLPPSLSKSCMSRTVAHPLFPQLSRIFRSMMSRIPALRALRRSCLVPGSWSS